MGNVLEVEGVSIAFTRYLDWLSQETVTVVQELDLSLAEGEIVAVVGASGSGKSLLAHAILGILPHSAHMEGRLRYRGEVLDPAKLELLRGKEIALVPQSITSLDPMMRVGSQVRAGMSGRAEAQQRLFRRFGLSDRVERMYPHQLSGGMARRVLVSTAAVSRPSLVVADEPTPGMHASDVQEALLCFKEMSQEGSAVLLITHDLESALTVADRVAVLYGGSMVEIASAQDFSDGGSRLRHPYTKALWAALPQNGFAPLAGSMPQPGAQSSGCIFASRCSSVTEQCLSSRPGMRSVRAGDVRCFHAS